MLGLLNAWIDIPLIKGGIHHASGALAAAATFKAIGSGIDVRLTCHGWYGKRVLLMPQHILSVQKSLKVAPS